MSHPAHDAAPDGDAAEPEASIRALLLQLGTAMVATGETVDEVEQELHALGDHLGYPELQTAAAPTGVTLNLRPGGAASYQSATASLRLDQVVDVRRVLYRLLADLATPEEALQELRQLGSKPPRYAPGWWWAGAVGVAVGIGLILQPGLPNIVVSALAALVVTALSRLARRSELLTTLLPTVAALVVALMVFSAAGAGLLDGPLRTLLPPLAVMLPGALLVTGISEVASGHMVAGSSRLTYGIVQLLLLSLGIVTAAGVLQVDPGTLANVRMTGPGWWAAPLGLLLIAFCVCLLESTSLRLLPWILAVLLGAFAAQLLGQQLGGAPLGSFLGAVAASLGASLCEAVRPRLPRLVIFMPAFWLLVPGSLGLLSVTQLAIRPAQTGDTGIDVVTVVCAIALGLLVGSAVARSLRQLLRRVRRVPARRAADQPARADGVPEVSP